MLDQENLTKALKGGQSAADACGHFCRAGAAVDNGTYRIHHNGLGSRDSDVQAVHADAVLGMTTEKLAERIATWITGLHRGERVNLNAALEIDTDGPALTGWPWTVAPESQWVTDGPDPDHVTVGMGLATEVLCRTTCTADHSKEEQS